jgi:hypothetical protein
MIAADRAKAARLESILAKHAAAEVKTLADLRKAGFKFTTISAAFQRLKTQRTLAGFTQEQLDLATEVLDRAAARKSA